MRAYRDSEAGTTLVEVMAAALIMLTGVLAMVQLISLSTAQNLLSRNATVAAILAEQKLEQLRALAWGFDASGVPVSDLTTDTTTVPESPNGGTGLRPSPATALQTNTPGYVDHVSAVGRIVGRGALPPLTAVYTRRWSIEPVVTSPEGALVIQVLVSAVRDRGRADQGNVGRLPGEARVATVKVRKPR
jgi:Flp pilus assembly protein TadG